MNRLVFENPCTHRWYLVEYGYDLIGDYFLRKSWGSKNSKHYGRKTTICSPREIDDLIEYIKKQRQIRGYEQL